MLVHPVTVPGSGTLSWTVLGDDDVPVVPVDRFLAYLTGIGRSPNTVKAYAHDLKNYWVFIGFRRLRTRPATALRWATCWPRGGRAGGAGGSRSCTTSARAGRIVGGRSR
jgi:hypothetical protein